VDEWPKNTYLSTNRFVFVDGLVKNNILSTEKGCFVDAMQWGQKEITE
jgi:hypothetical protein